MRWATLGKGRFCGRASTCWLAGTQLRDSENESRVLLLLYFADFCLLGSSS